MIMAARHPIGQLSIALLTVLLCGGGLLAQQPRDIAFFYRDVVQQLMGHQRLFNVPETAITFAIGARARELQVQFPSEQSDVCAIALRYVPAGEPSVRDQLIALRRREPDVSVGRAVSEMRLSHVIREIPCEGDLARLLRRGMELSIAFSVQSPDIVSVDVASNRVQIRSGALKLDVEFLETATHPVAAWARDVQHAVMDYIAADPDLR